MKYLPVLVASLCLSVALFAQGRLRIMEWNVENLFDTIHDEGMADYEFLPDGANSWTSVRYRSKLFGIARTIAAAGGDEPVSIIGLCEVENDRVIEDLTRHSALARLGYRYIVTNSADQRGVDVALLYQPDQFLPIAEYVLRVDFDPETETPTRDILVVDGCLPSGDTLTVAVCHLPSRRGGAERAASYRLRAARRLRAAADSIDSKRLNFSMIVMGDFNDEPADESVRVFDDDSFANLSAHAVGTRSVQGTYKYQGVWSRIDQMIVSRSMLDSGAHPRVVAQSCRVLSRDFQLERDAAGGLKPYRTYLGTYYHGGVSDHLPLLLDLAY